MTESRSLGANPPSLCCPFPECGRTATPAVANDDGTITCKCRACGVYFLIPGTPAVVDRLTKLNYRKTRAA